MPLSSLQLVPEDVLFHHMCPLMSWVDNRRLASTCKSLRTSLSKLYSFNTCRWKQTLANHPVCIEVALDDEFFHALHSSRAVLSGSYVLWQIEHLYGRSPAWTPDDLDIYVIGEEQELRILQVSKHSSCLLVSH